MKVLRKYLSQFTGLCFDILKLAFGVMGRIVLYSITYMIMPVYRQVRALRDDRMPMSQEGVVMWFDEELVEYEASNDVGEWFDMLGTYRIALEDANGHAAAWILERILAHEPPPVSSQATFFMHLNSWFKSQRMRGRGHNALNARAMLLAINAYVSQVIFLTHRGEDGHISSHYKFVHDCNLEAFTGPTTRRIWNM